MFLAKNLLFSLKTYIEESYIINYKLIFLPHHFNLNIPTLKAQNWKVLVTKMLLFSIFRVQFLSFFSQDISRNAKKSLNIRGCQILSDIQRPNNSWLMAP